MELIIEAIMFVFSFVMKAKNFYILLFCILVITGITALIAYFFTGNII